MKVTYYPDTDSLYIDLSEQTSVDSREVSAGVVLDYGEGGRLVGVDTDYARGKVQLDRLVVTRLPAEVETKAHVFDDRGNRRG